MEKSIRHRFFFSHPPEKVWDYLTKSELLALWIMKNNFQLVIGAEFQFKTNPIPSLDFDGIFYCKVLEIEQGKKLSYTWQSGPGNGKITLDSTVVWKLEPRDNGTDLYLEHYGFEKEENLNFYNGLTDGWLKNIRKMADCLNIEMNDKTSN